MPRGNIEHTCIQSLILMSLVTPSRAFVSHGNSTMTPLTPVVVAMLFDRMNGKRILGDV